MTPPAAKKAPPARAGGASTPGPGVDPSIGSYFQRMLENMAPAAEDSSTLFQRALATPTARATDMVTMAAALKGAQPKTAAVGLSFAPAVDALFPTTKGIPKGCTTVLTGPPGTLKTRASVTALLRYAATAPCALVVAEESLVTKGERFDLLSRISAQATALVQAGVLKPTDLNTIPNNLLFIQAQHHKGVTFEDFVGMYHAAIATHKAKFIVVDSLTALDPYSNRTSQRLSCLKTYNHENDVTCVVIGQIRGAKGEAQGGDALIHAADVAIHIEDTYIGTKAEAEAENVPVKSYIRTIRGLKSSVGPIITAKQRLALPAPDSPASWTLTLQ